MKAIFEEYGFVILAAVVIILLIGMTSPVGDAIENSIIGIVDNMSAQVNDQITLNNHNG